MRHLFFILSIFTLGILQAQEPVQKDVKVGLVLSGGGAKGLAHIGALKVIEEAGIRIDYIAGTSMGAIVGGLYASGYNATAIDSIFKAVDFDRLIQDDLPRSAKTFYEKDDAERYAVTLPFDNFKLSFPRALSKGQNTYNLLSQVLGHVDTIQDFEQLPIPFFCVATDVENGQQVILDSGYLPEALSASGALPSLFSPVLLNDRVLIDGGVINNYPVDELKTKGIDYVIGIDVQDRLRDRESLQTAPEILMQINNYRTIQAMEEKKKRTDVYIRPDIDDFSVVSFDEGAKIVEKGRVKAFENYEALREIGMMQRPLSRKRTPPPKPKDSITLDAVNITGNENYTRAYILGKLKLNPPQKVSYSDFNSGLNNLAATENFERINHRLTPTPDGQVLQLNLRESSSTQSIRLGVHYDDLYRSAALVNFTKKRLLFKNDIATLDFIIGDNVRYNFNYYIDKGYYWSVGVRSTYNTFDKGVDARFVENVSALDFGGVNRVNLEYQDVTNQLFLQTLFLKEFSLDLGAQHKFLDVETETIVNDATPDESFIFEKSHLGGVYAQLRYDSLDDLYFPSSGVYFDGDFDLYLFSSDFNNNFTEFSIAKARFKYAKSVTSNFTLITELAGGFKIGGAETRSLDFFLGGYGNQRINNLVPFLGYDFISFGGDGFVKAGLTADFEIFNKNHINLSANFANAGDDLFSSEDWLPPPAFTGYAIGYGLESFLGPLEVKYSYSPEIKSGEWFVSLGYRF
ncbi:patatin [Dokdonia sinensis]|uniref:Patatin n=1 Tax=Dokdonia sinensis TaxID=2479847 RepID=A0A3M0H0Z5_9FLAO|nr:patatin-like phospholipase family protein [Dokdonia sinensis]RMB63256.1 patatin [Dokdonia sinensis]